MRWLRLYDDTINDPKILKLPEAMRWHWIAMLCVASKNEGALPSLDDVAIQLRVTTGKATEIIAVLVKAGLLDKTETGFAPHNWNGRQYKSDVSTERVKRFRNAKRNVSETPPDTEAETDTEVEKKETREDALSPGFEQFWRAWPNKVGKPAAAKAWAGATKRGAGFNAIMNGVENYIRDKPPDRSWLNPATFLNQNRWEDQPAQVANGRIQEVQSLSHIARRHAAEGISFGERPASPSARLNESRPDVRLLSKGGSERPGDLCGSDIGSLERISAGDH